MQPLLTGEPGWKGLKSGYLSVFLVLSNWSISFLTYTHTLSNVMVWLGLLAGSGNQAVRLETCALSGPFYWSEPSYMEMR